MSTSTSARVVKNTMFLYIRMGVSIIANLFITRLLLEALGVSDYGLYNVVGGAIAMLGFISASMSPVTQRFINYAEGKGDKEHILKIFNNSILIHRYIAMVVVGVLAIAGFFFFNGILNIPEGRETVAGVVYACLLFSTVYSITIVPYDALLNAHENMLYYSLLGIADVIFKLLISIVVYYIDTERLVFYAVLMALEALLLRVITKRYCTKHYDESRTIEINRYKDKVIIREMLSFAGWNLASIATGMISLFGMNVVVNHFFGTTVNAAMGIATQLSGVMMAVSANMIKALTPVLVKNEGANNRMQMLKVTYVGCKFSFLLSAFVCIPVLFVLNPILRLWLHEIPEWTQSFCAILIVATLIEQLTVFLYQSIMAEGNIKRYNVVRSIFNVMPILTSIVFFVYINDYPYFALINWLLFKSLFGGFVNLYYAKKNINLSLRYFMKDVIIPCITTVCISSGLSYGLMFLLSHNNKLQLVGFLIIILINFPLYWIFALSKVERIAFLNVLNKIRER